MKIAEIPVCPNSDGVYDITKPGELIYFSNHLGQEVPREARARLGNDIDMTGADNFQSIGRRKEDSFRGEFDGCWHVIRGLQIVMHGKKNVAFIGYLGDDLSGGVLRRLGLVDFICYGSKNIGGLTGVNYGLIEQCFCKGTICGDYDTNAVGAGGITGKNHGQEDGTPGLIKDCWADVETHAAFSIGGIAGKDEGGLMENCLAAGSIRALNPNGQAGGLIGAFNGGSGAVNCVTALRSIKGVKDIDKTVGQLDDEDGHQMSGVLAWEGMRLLGNPPVEQNFKWKETSASLLSSQTVYESLGWDFQTIWVWGNGYPVLRGFSPEVQRRKISWEILPAAVNVTPPQSVSRGWRVPIEAQIATDSKVSGVNLIWENTTGGGKNCVKMEQVDESRYFAVIPPPRDDIRFCVEAETEHGQAGGDRWYQVKVDSGEADSSAKHICLTIGERETQRRVNWITDPRIQETVLRYRECGNANWRTIRGESRVCSVTKGYREVRSHKAEFDSLLMGHTYEYQVGNGTDMSGILSFTVSDPTDGFRFLLGSDSQSVTVEDYSTYVKCMRWALSQGREFAFAVMGGDISQDGYKSSQWAAFFEAAGDMFSRLSFAPVMGNHDMKGDGNFIQFKTHFNMPRNGIGGLLEGPNYFFTYGDATFYVLETECKRAAQFKPMMAQQLEWLERTFQNERRKWNIVLLHSGPYTGNHDGSRVRAMCPPVFEKLGIDLVLGGHDHLYIRSSMLEGRRVPLGKGVTYVTCGTVGNKFYEWMPFAEEFTEIYHDEIDKQILCETHIKGNKLTFTAWQKSDSKDKDCQAFKACDTFTLLK